MDRGERDPARGMLVEIAKKYHRPLLTFYLADPPAASDKGEDFRTLPEEPPPGAEALRAALLRNVQARQGLVRAALEEAEEDETLSFVGSPRISDGVETLVAAMRATLGASLPAFRRQRTVDDAFKLLRDRAEQYGVFVLLMGNLGSHHTGIDARLFRGFALADPIAPFVVVNENDPAPPGRSRCSMSSSTCGWARPEQSLVLTDEADPVVVAEVTLRGYGQLDEIGLEKIVRDPFLISCTTYADKLRRTVVTLEVSAPREQPSAMTRRPPVGPIARGGRVSRAWPGYGSSCPPISASPVAARAAPAPRLRGRRCRLRGREPTDRNHAPGDPAG